jgi:hypothetical protein
MRTYSTTKPSSKPSTEHYWAQVQRLREELSRLRPTPPGR